MLRRLSLQNKPEMVDPRDSKCIQYVCDALIQMLCQTVKAGRDVSMHQIVCPVLSNYISLSGHSKLSKSEAGTREQVLEMQTELFSYCCNTKLTFQVFSLIKRTLSPCDWDFVVQKSKKEIWRCEDSHVDISVNNVANTTQYREGRIR